MTWAVRWRLVEEEFKYPKAPADEAGRPSPPGILGRAVFIPPHFGARVPGRDRLHNVNPDEKFGKRRTLAHIKVPA